jgi:hypothetical protein
MLTGTLTVTPKIGYDIREAAEAIGASEREIAICVGDGTLKAYRIDGHCVVLTEDLIKYVRSMPLFLEPARAGSK